MYEACMEEQVKKNPGEAIYETCVQSVILQGPDRNHPRSRREDQSECPPRDWENVGFMWGTQHLRVGLRGGLITIEPQARHASRSVVDGSRKRTKQFSP